MIAGILYGCGGTRYVEGRPSEVESARPGRLVNYEIDPSYWRRPAKCIALGKVAGLEESPGGDAAVRAAFGRHLRERNFEVRDTAVGKDSRRTAMPWSGQCGFHLVVNVKRAESTNLLFWSRREIAIVTELVRDADGRRVWWAAHSDAQSVGGLPLSPISASLNIADATSNSLDHEANLSLVDAVARRIVNTLPSSG